MIVKEFGEIDKDTLILLHGGGLSWWNYKDEIELLKNDFHIVVPILDGHSGSDRYFTSTEENSDEIIKYIDEKFDGKVKLISGLSLGGQILVDILSKRENICEYAIIESTLVIPMKITNKLIKPSIQISYGLISKKWFAKIQSKSLKIREDLFEDYYKDTCNITKENLISFMKSNSNYKLKPSFSNNNAEILIIVGQKEQKVMKKSAELLHKNAKNSKLEVLEGYYHGEFSLNNSKEYINKIYELIKKQ